MGGSEYMISIRTIMGHFIIIIIIIFIQSYIFILPILVLNLKNSN